MLHLKYYFQHPNGNGKQSRFEPQPIVSRCFAFDSVPVTQTSHNVYKYNILNLCYSTSTTSNSTNHPGMVAVIVTYYHYCRFCLLLPAVMLYSKLSSKHHSFRAILLLVSWVGNYGMVQLDIYLLGSLIKLPSDVGGAAIIWRLHCAGHPSWFTQCGWQVVQAVGWAQLGLMARALTIISPPW